MNYATARHCFQILGWRFSFGNGIIKNLWAPDPAYEGISNLSEYSNTLPERSVHNLCDSNILMVFAIFFSANHYTLVRYEP